MNLFKKPLLALGLLTVFSVASVHAETPRAFDYSKASASYVDNTSGGNSGDSTPFYFGAMMGPSEGKSYCVGGANCEDSDTAWKLFAGYQLTDMFNIEGSYMSLGDLHQAGSNSDVSAMTIHATAALPLTDQVDLFGKLGAARWSSNNTSGDTSGIDFAYGLGAKVRINETTKLRAEWEKVPGVETSDTAETDITMMSVGVELSTY